MYVYVCNSAFAGGDEGREKQDALSVFHLESSLGILRHVQTVEGVRSPSYLVRNPILPVIYVAERWINADKSTPTAEQLRGDAVATFLVDENSGTLSILDRRSTGGIGTMHLNVDQGGRYLFAANPGRPKDPDPVEGHTTALRLSEDGTPASLTGSVSYGGRPPLWRDRPKSYPHSVFGDPAWRRLFVPHLMTDRVMIYDFNAETGQLTPPAGQPYVQVSSGAGPRHLAFHPDGRFFYVANSFDATISVFAYDAESGLARIVQTAPVHPEGFAGTKKTSLAHILVSPDGLHLYCCHRTHNSIAVFAVDQATGELGFVQRQDSGGLRPFHFALDKAGETMVVANQKSNEIVSFHVDRQTGTITPTGQRQPTYAPNCLAM